MKHVLVVWLSRDTETMTDTIAMVGTVPMSLVLVLDVSGWTALVVVVMRMTWTAVFSMTGVFTHALTHRMSLSRALQLNLPICSVSTNMTRVFQVYTCGRSLSKRGPVALCTLSLGLGVLNPTSSRGR